MSDSIHFDGIRFLSAGEAAQLTGLTRDYVGRLCRHGWVRGHQLGSRWYVDLDSLRAFRSAMGAKKVALGTAPVVPMTVRPHAHFTRALREREAAETIVPTASALAPHVMAALLIGTACAGVAYGIVNPQASRIVMQAMRGDPQALVAATASGTSRLDAISGRVYRWLCPLFDDRCGVVVYMADATDSSYSSAAESSSSLAAAPVATSSPSTTIINNTYPVAERVIERTLERTLPPDDGVFTARLQTLENTFTSRIAALSGSVQHVYTPVSTFAQSTRIDTLSGVSVSGSTWTGGSITDATITGGSVAATTLSGVVSIEQGGTGTTTAPTYGQLLLGTAQGGYTLVATSSLGITGAGASTWGTISGTLSNQTDLQTALDGKLSLSSWYATTTTALTEGANLYYTTARATTSFIQNLAATTSVASITTLPSLSLPYAQLTGAPTSMASSTLLSDSNTFSGANAFTGNTSLAQATSTSLAVTSVANALHLANGTGGVIAYTGSSCTNQFVRSVNGAGVATCASVNLATDTTGTLAVSSGGTGTTTAPAGQVLYGGGAGVYQSVATTTLSLSGPFNGLSSIGTLVGGTNSTITWTGLATTSQPTSSELLVSNGGAGVYGVATTSVSCSGSVSCTGFTILGPSPITITGSGGGSWPFTPTTNFGQSVESTTTALWLNAPGHSLFASSSVQFGTAGGSQFFWDGANNRLGIGTTTPWKLLSIAGDVATNHLLPNGPYTTNLSSYDLGATGQRWNALWAGTLNVGTSTFSITSDSASNLGFFTAASGGGTQAMTITSSGKVGIGTTSPLHKLVVGSGTENSRIYISGGTGSLDATARPTTDNAQLSLGRFDTTDGGGVEFNTSPSGSGYGWKIAAPGADSRTDMRFLNRHNSATWSEKFTIQGSTGNVGIGTTTPAATLSVNGNIYLPTVASSASIVLLHMNGTASSTTFTNSGGPFTIAAGGNAQIGTYQTKFGGGSGVFDNSGDFVSINMLDTLYFYNNFTIDFWIYPTSLQSNDYLIDGLDTSGSFPSRIYTNASGQLIASFYYSSTQIISITCAASTITTNSWQHVALVRSGSTATLYKDGTSCGNDTSASGTLGFINGGTSLTRIGSDSTGTGSNFGGYMDEFRIVENGAVWTSNFTPPTDEHGAISGGIGLGVANPLNPIQHSSGAVLSVGGNWINASDRKLKENFTAVDDQDILSRVSGLPITKWNYIVEGSAIPHIGPVAQDFYEQFALGNSSTTISTIDSAGIALVGVKALNEKLESMASSTATTTDATGAPTFLGRFLARLVAWFADAANGIGDFFANRVRTKELCVSDGNGETCITRAQLDALLLGQTAAAATPPSTAPPTAEPTPEPAPEPGPTPDPVPESTPPPTEPPPAEPPTTQ